MIIRQTASSIRRKYIKHAKAFGGGVLITWFFNFQVMLSHKNPSGKPWDYLTACSVLFAVLSLIYYMKSKTDDNKLQANGKEIEINDDLIVFRKYKNGNINNEKKYAIDLVRGFREKGPYIMIKIGALREKQVLDFEYEANDIEALKNKLKELSIKRMHSNAHQQ